MSGHYLLLHEDAISHLRNNHRALLPLCGKPSHGDLRIIQIPIPGAGCPALERLEAPVYRQGNSGLGRRGFENAVGLISWWWTKAVDGHQESTISEVMEQECSMYQPDENLQTPLPNMLYSLAQRVARQDPAYYQVLITLRPKSGWRLPLPAL